MIYTSRRKFIYGLFGLVAAPAVIRVADLMPIKPYFDFDFDTDNLLIRSTERYAAFMVDKRILIGQSTAWLESEYSTKVETKNQIWFFNQPNPASDPADPSAS